MQVSGIDEEWWKHLDDVFAQAVRKAIMEHKQHGHPIYYKRPDVPGVVKEMSDGTCYEVTFEPNGQEIIIREIAKQ